MKLVAIYITVILENSTAQEVQHYNCIHKPFSSNLNQNKSLEQLLYTFIEIIVFHLIIFVAILQFLFL